MSFVTSDGNVSMMIIVIDAIIGIDAIRTIYKEESEKENITNYVLLVGLEIRLRHWCSGAAK